jgi:hypothetical protein
MGYLIRFLTDKWATDLDKSDNGLQDAGILNKRERELHKDLDVQESLYVKGFGAAAVQKWLQRRTLLKK